MEETIARLFQVFLALLGAYTLALWFALAVWAYRDITARTTNPVVQVFSTLLVVLFFAPGAIIYLILRPRETLDEAFQRTMEEEYLVQDLEEFPLCPSCRRAVRDDFVFCPYCQVELRGSCRNCRRLIDLRWEICAYCGADQFPSTEEDEAQVSVADAVTAHAFRRVADPEPEREPDEPELVSASPSRRSAGRSKATAKGNKNGDDTGELGATVSLVKAKSNGHATTEDAPETEQRDPETVAAAPKSRRGRGRGSGPRPAESDS